MAERGPYTPGQRGREGSAYGSLADIRLQEDRLSGLYSNAVRPGMVSDAQQFLGILGSGFRAPEGMKRERQASLNEAAEEMAPDLAREEGISVDEARQRIAGGVQDPEAPLHRLGRWFGIGEAPAGEPFEERVGRLRGMERRLQRGKETREEARDEFRDLLTTTTKLDDPRVMQPFLQRAAERAGYTGLPELNLRRSPGSLWEWFEQSGRRPEDYTREMRPEREPRAPTEAELEQESFLSPDPQKRKWAKTRMRRGRTGTRAEAGRIDPSVQRMVDQEIEIRSKIILEDGSLSPQEKDAALNAMLTDVRRKFPQALVDDRTAGAGAGGGGERPGETPPPAPVPPADSPDDFLKGLGY